MYRFALRPVWWLSHLLAFSLIGAMIWASLWQVGRLSEVRDRNDRIEARTATDAVDVGQLVGASSTWADGGDLEFRPVTATGTFDRDAEVLVRNRPRDGAPGTWILTPLVLADGRAVIVNRGWIPRRLGPEDPRPEADPPTGQVTIGGWLRPTEVQRGLGASDAPDGVLTSVARPDLARLDAQTSQDLLPVFIQMSEVVEISDTTQRAEGTDLPLPLALPELSDGPHLSYAVQWAIYATVGIVGYPLILRRVARNRAEDQDATHA